MPPLLPQDSDNILIKSPEPYYTNEGKSCDAQRVFIEDH